MEPGAWVHCHAVSHWLFLCCLDSKLQTQQRGMYVMYVCTYELKTELLLDKRENKCATSHDPPPEKKLH